MEKYTSVNEQVQAYSQNMSNDCHTKYIDTEQVPIYTQKLHIQMHVLLRSMSLVKEKVLVYSENWTSKCPSGR